MLNTPITHIVHFCFWKPDPWKRWSGRYMIVPQNLQCVKKTWRSHRHSWAVWCQMLIYLAWIHYAVSFMKNCNHCRTFASLPMYTKILILNTRPNFIHDSAGVNYDSVTFKVESTTLRLHKFDLPAWKSSKVLILFQVTTICLIVKSFCCECEKLFT